MSGWLWKHRQTRKYGRRIDTDGTRKVGADRSEKRGLAATPDFTHCQTA